MLLMGLVEFRAELKFGWATKSDGQRGRKMQPIAQRPTTVGWLRKWLVGARSHHDNPPGPSPLL